MKSPWNPHEIHDPSHRCTSMSLPLDKAARKPPTNASPAPLVSTNFSWFPVAHSGPVVPEEILEILELGGCHVTCWNMPSEMERCWEVGSFPSRFWRENIYISYIGHIVEVGCFHATLTVASLGGRCSLSNQQWCWLRGKFLSPKKLSEFLHSKIHMAQKSGNPKDWVFSLKNDHQQNISPWSQMMCGSSSYPKLGRFGVFHFVWCSTPFLNHSNGAMNQTFAPPLTQLTGCFHPPWAEQQPGTSSPETTGRTPCNWLVASSEQHASASVFQPYFFCNHHPQKRKGLSLLVFNRIYIWSEWFKDILENPKKN